MKENSVGTGETPVAPGVRATHATGSSFDSSVHFLAVAWASFIRHAMVKATVCSRRSPYHPS